MAGGRFAPLGTVGALSLDKKLDVFLPPPLVLPTKGFQPSIPPLMFFAPPQPSAEDSHFFSINRSQAHSNITNLSFPNLAGTLVTGTGPLVTDGAVGLEFTLLSSD